MEPTTKVEINAHAMVSIHLPQAWQYPSEFLQLCIERGLPRLNVYFHAIYAEGAIARIRKVAAGFQDHPEIVATLERIEQRLLTIQATWLHDHPAPETAVVPMNAGRHERRGHLPTC